MAYQTGPRTPGDIEEMNIVMRVVPKPSAGERNVLAWEDGREEPLLAGTGHNNFLCGECRTVLAGSMGPEEIEGAPLFKCYRCGSYNEIP